MSHRSNPMRKKSAIIRKQILTTFKRKETMNHYFFLMFVVLFVHSGTAQTAIADESPKNVGGKKANSSLIWPSRSVRKWSFEKVVSEIDRLDGDGLLPRGNRPQSWHDTIAILSEKASHARDFIEFGHVFRLLDATYPNLHARAYLAPELDSVQKTGGRPQIAATFGAVLVDKGVQEFTYKVFKLRSELLNAIPEQKRPKLGDDLLEINGRSMKGWSIENFIFCKFPLREQCELEFFDHFRKENLSWTRSSPLKYTLRRGSRIWTVAIPTKKSPGRVSFTPDPPKADEPCGTKKGRYPDDFRLVYQGTHVCAFERLSQSNEPIIRIDSFRYFDEPKASKYRSIGEDVAAFWTSYWQVKSAQSKRVLLDVIDNHGGDTPMEWYKLFFTAPFQEQYVAFRNIAELSRDPNVQDELFYKEKAKHIWFDAIKTQGKAAAVIGAFLPPVPQFCADDNKDCREGLFLPRDNKFSGKVDILINQWCVSSCVGFIWNFRDVLGDRVAFYGVPDSGDSAYGRVYLDVYLDPASKEGFRTRISPRPGSTIATLPEGAILRQSISVTRSTDSKGKIVSGIPMTVDHWVLRTYEQYDDDWNAAVVKAALSVH